MRGLDPRLSGSIFVDKAHGVDSSVLQAFGDVLGHGEGSSHAASDIAYFTGCRRRFFYWVIVLRRRLFQGKLQLLLQGDMVLASVRVRDESLVGHQLRPADRLT